MLPEVYSQNAGRCGVIASLSSAVSSRAASASSAGLPSTGPLTVTIRRRWRSSASMGAMRSHSAASTISTRARLSLR